MSNAAERADEILEIAKAGAAVTKIVIDTVTILGMIPLVKIGKKENNNWAVAEWVYAFSAMRT